VQYFRAKLDQTQWREETEILACELQRTFQWFAKLCHTWRLLAGMAPSTAYAAYAHQAADIYARRAQRCREDAEKADKASQQYWAYIGQEMCTRLQTDYDIEPGVAHIISFYFLLLNYNLFTEKTYYINQSWEELIVLLVRVWFKYKVAVPMACGVKILYFPCIFKDVVVLKTKYCI